MSNPFAELFHQGKPLSGVVVLDLSRFVPGPFASLILSNLGATVVRVEQRGRGDLTRVQSPRSQHNTSSYLFDVYNYGKQSIEIDFYNPDDIERLRKLLPYVDVVMESFRPGVLQTLGLDLESLRRYQPTIILASLTGFGQDSRQPGHDINFMAGSGVLTLSMVPPHLPFIRYLYSGAATPLAHTSSPANRIGTSIAAHPASQHCNDNSQRQLSLTLEHILDTVEGLGAAGEGQPVNHSPMAYTIIPPTVYSAITPTPQRDTPLHQLPLAVTIPSLSAFTIADILGAYSAVVQILAQLFRVKYQRSSPQPDGDHLDVDPETASTPTTAHVDVSLVEAALPVVSMRLFHTQAGHQYTYVTDFFSGFFAFYTVYQTKDGYAALGAVEPQFWKAFLSGIQEYHTYSIQTQPHPSTLTFDEFLEALRWSRDFHVSRSSNNSNSTTRGTHESAHRQVSQTYQPQPPQPSPRITQFIAALQYNNYVKDSIQRTLITKTTDEWLQIFKKKGVHETACFTPIHHLDQVLSHPLLRDRGNFTLLSERRGADGSMMMSGDDTDDEHDQPRLRVVPAVRPIREPQKNIEESVPRLGEENYIYAKL